MMGEVGESFQREREREKAAHRRPASSCWLARSAFVEIYPVQYSLVGITNESKENKRNRGVVSHCIRFVRWYNLLSRSLCASLLTESTSHTRMYYSLFHEDLLTDPLVRLC